MALGDGHRLAVVPGGEDGRGGQHSFSDHFLYYAGYLSLSEVSYNVLSPLDNIYVMFVICGRSMWRSSFSQVIVV